MLLFVWSTACEGPPSTRSRSTWRSCRRFYRSLDCANNVPLSSWFWLCTRLFLVVVVYVHLINSTLHTTIYSRYKTVIITRSPRDTPFFPWYDRQGIIPRWGTMQKREKKTATKSDRIGKGRQACHIIAELLGAAGPDIPLSLSLSLWYRVFAV